MILLFEFCVVGTPISLQAKGRSKNRWKAKVAEACSQSWPDNTPPISYPVSIEITYFYDGAPLDVDNMLKPILDAMIGIALSDDAIVTDVKGRRRDINGAFRVRHASPVLISSFSNGKEFVYIRIFEAPDHQDLNS